LGSCVNLHYRQTNYHPGTGTDTPFISVSSDDSKLYFTAVDHATKNTLGYICSFIVSTSNFYWVSLGTFNNVRSMTNLGSDYLYIAGTETSGNDQPSLRKILLTTAAAQWSKYMGCHESPWAVGQSVSTLNDDSSIIYNYMLVGTATKYLIFFGLKESTGAYTSSVHRSSVACTVVDSIYYKDSKAYGLAQWGGYELYIYNTNDDSFNGIYDFGANTDLYVISIPDSGK
jgi:hypothetical protein